MNLRKVVMIAFMIVCTATVASSALAQGTQPAKATDGQAQSTIEPLSKKRLLKLLTLNDSTQQELAQIVGQKGVDFQPTPADERELHDAGASDDLIVAVRANYHNSATTAGSDANGAQLNNQPAVDRSQTSTANGSSPAPKKKGFFNKLNQKMDEATAKLTKVNAEVNKQAQTVQATTTQVNQTVQSAKTQATQTAQAIKTQTTQTAQSLKGNGPANVSTVQPAGPENAQPQTATSGPESNTVSNLTAATNAPGPSSADTSGASPATTSAPASLAGTYWNLISMTTKGETEKQSGAPGPDVEFCRDGKWGMLHYGGAREAGTYQPQGGRLLMKMEDGSLFGNFQIKRNGNEMTLDDGKNVLRLKYQHQAGC
jgi:hypothetical protein